MWHSKKKKISPTLPAGVIHFFLFSHQFTDHSILTFFWKSTFSHPPNVDILLRLKLGAICFCFCFFFFKIFFFFSLKNGMNDCDFQNIFSGLFYELWIPVSNQQGLLYLTFLSTPYIFCVWKSPIAAEGWKRNYLTLLGEIKTRGNFGIQVVEWCPGFPWHACEVHYHLVE